MPSGIAPRCRRIRHLLNVSSDTRVLRDGLGESRLVLIGCQPRNIYGCTLRRVAGTKPPKAMAALFRGDRQDMHKT